MFVLPRQLEDFVGVLTAFNVVALAVALQSIVTFDKDMAVLAGAGFTGPKVEESSFQCVCEGLQKRAGAVKLCFLEQVVDG
jgi:hypothetical protein